MLKIKVSSKGQVVIPVAVRTRLNIETGTELEVREGPDYVSLHPLPDDPVLATRGLLRPADESHSLVRELLQTKRALADQGRSAPAKAKERNPGGPVEIVSRPTLFDPIKR